MLLLALDPVHVRCAYAHLIQWELEELSKFPISLEKLFRLDSPLSQALPEPLIGFETSLEIPQSMLVKMLRFGLKRCPEKYSSVGVTDWT